MGHCSGAVAVAPVDAAIVVGAAVLVAGPLLRVTRPAVLLAGTALLAGGTRSHCQAWRELLCNCHSHRRWRYAGARMRRWLWEPSGGVDA